MSVSVCGINRENLPTQVFILPAFSSYFCNFNSALSIMAAVVMCLQCFACLLYVFSFHRLLFNMFFSADTLCQDVRRGWLTPVVTCRVVVGGLLGAFSHDVSSQTRATHAAQ